MAEGIFLDNIQNRYPIELLDNRPITEGNIVGMIWRYPYMLEIYEDLQEKSFLTFDGRFYFSIAKQMIDLKFTTFDEINVTTYMAERPAIKGMFDKKGGFKTINSLALLLDEVNMPKYYDDLLKSDILLGLHTRGFNVVSQMGLFKTMTSNDIYNHFDLLLNDLFVRKTLDLETADLSKGYGDFLQRANAGLNMGLSYKKSSPIMNYQTSGVRKGCTIVGATTSGGKSSVIAHHYIVNFVEEGKKIVLIINEEDEDAWRSLILTTVINTRIRQWDESTGHFTKGMSRKRFLEGGFTDEEWSLIHQAEVWLAQYPESIEYVKCFDYKIETIKKIVGKYSKQGYNVVMLDTFKAPDAGAGDNNPAWKQMVEGSKALFQATSKAGMYLIITAQVALRYNSVRKLSCEHLGGATAISEIADTVVIYRDLWLDELEGEKKYVKPFNYAKGENGKYTSTKVNVSLLPEKKYAVAFLAKVRAGEKGTEILYRKDIAFNVWKEVGYCEVAQF